MKNDTRVIYKIIELETYMLLNPKNMIEMYSNNLQAVNDLVRLIPLLVERDPNYLLYYPSSFEYLRMICSKIRVKRSEYVDQVNDNIILLNRTEKIMLENQNKYLNFQFLYNNIMYAVDQPAHQAILSFKDQAISNRLKSTVQDNLNQCRHVLIEYLRHDSDDIDDCDLEYNHSELIAFNYLMNCFGNYLKYDFSFMNYMQSFINRVISNNKNYRIANKVLKNAGCVVKMDKYQVPKKEIKKLIKQIRKIEV